MWFCKTEIWGVKQIYVIYRKISLYTKIDDGIHKDNAKDVETRPNTLNSAADWGLPKGKKKVIALMKDKLGGKTMKKFVGLRAKTYSYLTDDGNED